MSVKPLSVECLVGELVTPEGPSVLTGGRVAFTQVNISRLSVWDASGGVRDIADTGGGPNGSCLGSDGEIYIAQNRGIVGDWRADRVMPGSIQRVTPDGGVEVLVTEVDGVTLSQPNDLAFGPDGRLYFTDPGYFDLDAKPDPGRIFALNPDGTGELLLEVEPTYPNGIVVRPDGTVVWAESYRSRICERSPDGAVRVLVAFSRPDAVPDGMALAADGTLFVAVLFAGGIEVVSSDGVELGVLEVGRINSNCAFHGSELYITDFSTNPLARAVAPAGVLWRATLDTEGLEVFTGSVS